MSVTTMWRFKQRMVMMPKGRRSSADLTNLGGVIGRRFEPMPALPFVSYPGSILLILRTVDEVKLT